MIWDGDHSDSELGFKLYNYVNDNNLFQVIDEPTRYTDNCASLLDFILTDSPGYLDDIGTLPPTGDLDHYIIHASINFVEYGAVHILRNTERGRGGQLKRYQCVFYLYKSMRIFTKSVT